MGESRLPNPQERLFRYALVAVLIVLFLVAQWLIITIADAAGVRQRWVITAAVVTAVLLLALYGLLYWVRVRLNTRRINSELKEYRLANVALYDTHVDAAKALVSDGTLDQVDFFKDLEPFRCFSYFEFNTKVRIHECPVKVRRACKTKRVYSKFLGPRTQMSQIVVDGKLNPREWVTWMVEDGVSYVEVDAVNLRPWTECKIAIYQDESNSALERFHTGQELETLVTWVGNQHDLCPTPRPNPYPVQIRQ